MLKENRRLALFLAATTLSGFGNMLASPLYQIVQVQRLELSNVEIGYIRMVYYAMLILAYWLMGWVIDRYSPKHAMYFGIAGFTLVPLLYGAIGTYPFLLGRRRTAGVCRCDLGYRVPGLYFPHCPGKRSRCLRLASHVVRHPRHDRTALSTALADIVPPPVLFFAAFACGILALLIFVSEKSSANASLSQSA
ncbi:hypothetical protein LJK87_40595 [Paenibacillus sp. P25]|nr:hypothetical protein LJK87_40595 [Paenibacillus sp. P25]